MIKNLLLLLASILISLLFAEAVIRLTEERLGYSWMYRVPDAVLGWRLKPNTSYFNQIKEGTVKVTYNSNGWRDVEHSQEKETPGAIRIAVLGDSFMEAYSVGNNDYFARQLENLFNEESAQAEVLNFGVGGYGPLQYYLAFIHEAKPYRPKLVLMGLYLGNDIANVSFELESMRVDGLKVDSRPFLDSGDQHQFKIHIKNYDRAVRNYKFRSVFLSSALNRAAHRVYKERVVPVFSRREKKTEEFGEQLNLDTCKAYVRAWDTVERIFRKQKSETEKTNATFVIFSVPEMVFFTNPQKDRCSGAPSQENLSRLASKLNIPYIDLYPDFKNEINNHGISSVFRTDDLHWNEKGHALAAQAVYKALRNRNLVP